MNSSPLRGSGKLMALGGLSALGYVYLLRISSGPLERNNIDSLYVSNFLLTYVFLFVCYWLLVMPLLKGRRMDLRHLWFAIAFGLLFRVILLPSDMILEDDLYRYMWDGHMILEGVNPYQYPPSVPATEPYRTDYWNKINYPYVPTIYPPTLQHVFMLSQIVYPGSVLGIKFILTIFDIATIFLLLSLLEKLKLPPEWCLVYAWSPLVMKEIANSGHADSVSSCLLVLFLWLVYEKKNAASAAMLALLTLTKFFGLFLLPLLYVFWRWRHYAICLVTMILLYLPFLSLEFNIFRGFSIYAQEWRFNGGIYDLVESLFEQGNEAMANNSSQLARMSLMGVILLVTLSQTLRLCWRRDESKPFQINGRSFHEKTDLMQGQVTTLALATPREIIHEKVLLHACFVVIGTLLLCSPVVDPWYLVWVIPFLCIFPNRAWILFTGLVYLSYWYYYEYEFPGWLRWVEFGGFFALLVLETFIPRFRLRQNVI